MRPWQRVYRDTRLYQNSKIIINHYFDDKRKKLPMQDPFFDFQ